jgi:hypothetical protein
LIGVNNQYRGRSLENYREEFAALLIRAIGFAGGDPGKVIVLSIPDWGVTPFAQGRDRDKIAREIDAFNAVNLDESQKAGVSYIDVTEISRLAANRPELLATDGLHPSGLMYRLWVDELFPVAFQIPEESINFSPGKSPDFYLYPKFNFKRPVHAKWIWYLAKAK